MNPVSLLGILCVLAFGSNPDREPPVHPQDGPDVDLRVRVGEERVRVAIQFNLSFLDQLFDLPREDPEYVAQHELTYIREALREHLEKHPLIEIDGLRVAPVISEVELEEGDPEVAINFPKEGLMALTKVRVTVDHPVKSTPRRVGFVWHDFPRDTAIAFPWMKTEDIPRLTVIAEWTAGALSEQITLTAEEPSFTWHRPAGGIARRMLEVPEAQPPAALWRIPALSLGLLGLLLGLGVWAAFLPCAQRRPRWIGLLAVAILLVPAAAMTRTVGVIEIAGGEDPLSDLTPATALEVFRPLHANIYAAFDYEAESKIYDALSQSIGGPLLEELYEAVYRGLILEEAGNAVARVEWVRILEAEIEQIGVLGEGTDPGFIVRCRWRVHGSVFHFRHTHERTSEYLALYTVRRRPEGWRITGHQAIEQRRVDLAAEEAEDDGR